MMNGEIKDEEVTDALPEDLDVHGFVGPYQFPDNSRRRIPGFLYLFFSIVFFLFAIFFGSCYSKFRCDFRCCIYVVVIQKSGIWKTNK